MALKAEGPDVCTSFFQGETSDLFFVVAVGEGWKKPKKSKGFLDLQEGFQQPLVYKIRSLVLRQQLLKQADRTISGKDVEMGIFTFLLCGVLSGELLKNCFFVESPVCGRAG